MGTTYAITYDHSMASIPKRAIDSLLTEINLSVSTYIDTSTISRINRPGTAAEKISILENGKKATQERIRIPADTHFIENYKVALDIWRQSDGFFDATVMPLVNYWGFGYTPKEPVTKTDTAKVNAIMNKVGMEKITLTDNASEMVIIKPSETELDFSALAKGYAVDAITTFISDRGVHNILVEIGGEISATGTNPQGQPWRVGLNKPKPEASLTEVTEIITLSDISLASSGNYRNFHEVDGKKYGHEINPKSGYPQETDVLGVSILAPTCMEADAVSTACMIMGLESSLTFLEDRQHLEGCLFTSDAQGHIVSHTTTGFDRYLDKKESH